MYECIDHLYYSVSEVRGLWVYHYVRCQECNYEVIMGRDHLFLRWRKSRRRE